jgi:hypothetical protein
MFKKTACDSPFVEAPCFLHRQVRLTDLLEYRGQRHLHTTQSLSWEKPFKKPKTLVKCSKLLRIWIRPDPHHFDGSGSRACQSGSETESDLFCTKLSIIFENSFFKLAQFFTFLRWYGNEFISYTARCASA